MDAKKIVNICLIIISIFLYFVASQIAEMTFDGLDLPIQRDLFLTYPEMIGLCVAVLGFLAVWLNKVAVQFLHESVVELGKVVYPTRKESGQSAVVVMVMVGVATVCLAFFDMFWSSFTHFVLAN